MGEARQNTSESDLRAAGFILLPSRDRARLSAAAARARNISVPRLVRPSPRAAQISSGLDICDGSFLAKAPGSDRCLIPRGADGAYTPLLPAFQRMIDQAYAWPDARDRYFLLRASRHTAEKGEYHQSQVPDWHDHVAQGPCRIQIFSDTVGTRFRIGGEIVAPPDGHIVEFDETVAHCTPVMDGRTRRTCLILLSYARYPILHGVDIRNPLERLITTYPYGVVDEMKLHRVWRAAAVETLAQDARGGEQEFRPHLPMRMRRVTAAVPDAA